MDEHTTPAAFPEAMTRAIDAEVERRLQAKLDSWTAVMIDARLAEIDPMTVLPVVLRLAREHICYTKEQFAEVMNNLTAIRQNVDRLAHPPLTITTPGNITPLPPLREPHWNDPSIGGHADDVALRQVLREHGQNSGPPATHAGDAMAYLLTGLNNDAAATTTDVTPSPDTGPFTHVAQLRVTVTDGVVSATVGGPEVDTFRERHFSQPLGQLWLPLSVPQPDAPQPASDVPNGTLGWNEMDLPDDGTDAATPDAAPECTP